MEAVMEIVDDDDDDVMEVSVPAEDEYDIINTVRLKKIISLSRHVQMVTHVVWPRKLPTKVADFPPETPLIALMTDTLESMENAMDIFASSSKLFRGIYNTNTSPHADIIMAELNRLKRGDMFAFYLKEQNCGFSVYVPPSANNSDDATARPESAIVSTFPLLIPIEEIYEAKHSDFQMEFPSKSVTVGFSTMLNSVEFSQQLSHLNSNAVNNLHQGEEDKPCGSYVSQWLLPMLSTHEHILLRQTEFPIISKKIRDEVIGTKSQHLTPPFRRSTFWTFLKAILQLNLTIEVGGELIGRVVYKLAMLKALTVLCNIYNSELYGTLDVDTVLHMLAKMARRIEKLHSLVVLLDNDYPNKFDALPDGFEETYNATLDESKLVIFKVKERLDRQIDQIQSTDEDRSTLDQLSDLHFEEDVRQKVPKLRKHLTDRQKQLSTPNDQLGDKLILKLYSRVPIASVDPPALNQFDKLKSPIDIGIFLCDFENWILYTVYDINGCRPETLRSLSFSYERIATKHYKDDPLGFSRMVLTLLKILTLLDKIATLVHPQIKKHRPGISQGIFENLLLPQYEDFDIAYVLKKYFGKRAERAKYPSLIEEEKVSNASFANRFAAKSEEMQDIVNRIKDSTDATIAQIEKEWETKRKEVDVLRKKQASMHCEYTINSNGKRQHKESCASCKLSSKILNVRVTTFEMPLPEDECERNAVVFELRIPIEIACLRDVLYRVVTLLNEPTGKVRTYGKWIQSDVLEEFDQSASECVFLGTSIKGRVCGRTRNRGVHPDQPFSACTLDNQRSCIYYGEKDDITLHIPTSIDAQSTLKSGSSLGVEKGSPYEGLQWTFGITHTQNEVIARQFECPQSLTLGEFKNFGSLRADGHRLQLRKLYAMIETESLAFETLSVQALIMQCLWEMGPVNPNALHWNESHQDFTDPKFALAMIELIDKFIDTQKSNWKHPLKLTITVLIAVRVFEMNDDESVADRIVQLLVKLRDIAFDWIHKVQAAMHETHATEQSDMEKLRSLLVEIAVAGALTFFVHFRHQYYDKIFIGSIVNSITATRFWLEFLVTVNDNNSLFAASKEEKGPHRNTAKRQQEMFQRLLLRIAVQLQSKVREMIVNDPNDLFEFVKQQWNRSCDGSTFRLKESQKHPETLIVSVLIANNEYFVQIGIITGEFLVNNSPISRLPKTITQHPDFRRVFGDFIFEVQEANGRFDTKFQYKNCYYSFRTVVASNESNATGSGGTIIITERKENGDEFELIPERHFSGEIPHLLIENHSHWWCKTRNLIEFRSIHFADFHSIQSAAPQYELDLNGHLMDKKSKKIMLDVTSGSYKKIVKQLARLESHKYIHIFMNDPMIAQVELVRMNIKFLVDATNKHPNESYDVISNEFDGMRVASVQNCGTLYGLRQGLLLESHPNDVERPEQKRLLILPHGVVASHVIGQHTAVVINIEVPLRTPTFFIYQIDEVQQQLKANNPSHSAWFYLAYLHALTSHGLPDTFTEMSGTERSFQILQSAFAWSPSPYDDEALTTLKLFEKLAPNRRIKNGLQSIRWPDIVESHAAHDGFLIVTKRLISDSRRLDGLHAKTVSQKQQNSPKTKDKPDEKNNNNTDDIDFEATVREYYRNLPFFPNLRLSNTFIRHKITVSTHHIHLEKDETLHAVRTISNLYHQQKFISPKSLFSITEYLTKSNDVLKGPRHVDDNVEILERFVRRLRNKWLTLYNVARSGQFSREKFSLLLGLLAVENIGEDNVNAILLLQTVAENPTIFNGIDPPVHAAYDLSDRSYSDAVIEWILEQHETKEHFEIRHVISVRDFMHTVKTKIRDMWPADEVHPSIYQRSHPNVNLREAVAAINERFRRWKSIDQLMQFLRKIDIQVRRLNFTMQGQIDTIQPWYPEKLPFKRMQKYHIDFEAKIEENLSLYEADVVESQQIFTQPQSTDENKDWWFVYKTIASPNDAQHLVDAGMYPRLVLSLVLPKLLSRHQNPKLKSIILAIGVQIVLKQRKRRIAIYSQRPEMKAALEQEQVNEPHTNWLPSEHPEWLLFEIEQDLTIRPIQIAVAKRMINPPAIGTKHSVMQLNMGEGKTAVIVPILAAILANGTQVCQVTVLKSLFVTNLKGLRQSLGGMLNRRLYTFPCRRDMPINKYAEKILNIYGECRSLKGVVLTLPEYRLSFQLKIYEAASKGDTKCAETLLDTHKWLNENVRNILDESDAILQPKYQLIYTLGDQLSLDGGAERWTVIQGLLKQLPRHLKKLWERHGDEKIEFDSNYVKNGQAFAPSTVAFRSDVFTPCRILDNDVYESLEALLIDDILRGGICNLSQGVSHAVKQKLSVLLQNEDVTPDNYNTLLNDLTLTQQTTVHIVSAFLKFHVLRLALSKRWRVNYGVNENGPRQMAVPFKAKDVAADMTEFGHPDVAICLTQLSYYYSGLTEAQLHEVFKLLESQQNANEIYQRWIDSIPHQLVDDTIQSYNGVNLSDPKQRNELVFPLFKYNMHVIDYWLSNLVYPKEAKTFSHKLMCTAWDLVSDNFTHTVSGFSGTNDTKNILPLPIKQNDMKELEQTNDNVRKILLLPENSGYIHLQANVRGLQILIELSKLGIPVLLDAGACMLELNNEQVAKQWLNFVDSKLYDAAVYFDSLDVMTTVDRNGCITEFDCSVYRNKLDRCLVYLDDAHTRGTDLKFPPGWKACVTLSGDITRDKTVQACMRMRLLGRGHTVVFMASNEAHVRIRERCQLEDSKPTSDHVIDFICKNSQRFEEENTAHWSGAAYNYTKKLVAHKVYENATEQNAIHLLHRNCKDNELVTLKEMYGIKESALLTQISKNKFDKIVEAYRNDDAIVQMVEKISDGVSAKLRKQAPRVQRFTQFDEEQEKELEHELEEQRQIERPAPAIAATPVFDELLENLVKNGVTSQSFRRLRLAKGIMTLDESLLDNQLYEQHKDFPSPWSKNLYVTKDFITVTMSPENQNATVTTSSQNQIAEKSSEEYLRPVWWIARIIHREDDDIYLLLSSFETNRLLPLFRKSNRAVLMSYRPRLSQFHSNLLHDVALQVTAANTNPDDRIDLDDEVQIAMYAGSMYFKSAVEQDAYCGFMGLIPNPRIDVLEIAFQEGYIAPNSYVPPENRSHSSAIARFVKKCKFTHNPVELATKIIEAHHTFLRKESHVSAILEEARKKDIA